MISVALLLPLLLADTSPRESAYDGEISTAVADVEGIHYVPRSLVKAIIRVESDFNRRALSRKGAVGLMQVMPYTAPRVGLTEADLWHPAKNILAGTRLLAVLLRYYHCDLVSALVAYNSRPPKIFAPIAQNGETPGYVAAVLRFFEEYSTQSSGNHGARHESIGISQAKPDWLLIGVRP